MNPAHDDLKDHAGPYVFGSLDRDAQLSFEAHLAGCDECAAEVRALRRVADGLARSVPQRTPRPELRQRVLEAVVGHRPAPAAVHPVPARAIARWLPLAATILVTLGIAFYAGRLQTRVADLEARLDQAIAQAQTAEQAVADARRVGAELQSAMGVMAAPDLVRIDLKGQTVAPQASARALWSRARGMVFTASNLPPLPAGQVYQVWVVAAPAPVSAGLLMPDPSGAEQTFFNTSPDIPQPTAVAVTIEPAGGVPAPTGAVYLAGTPTASS